MDFPIEIYFYILDYITVYDLQSLQKTCTQFNMVVREYVEAKSTISAALLFFCKINNMSIVDLRTKDKQDKFIAKPNTNFLFFHYAYSEPALIVDNWQKVNELKHITHFQIQFIRYEKTIIFTNFASYIRFSKSFDLRSLTWERSDKAKQIDRKIIKARSQSITICQFECFKPKHHHFVLQIHERFAYLYGINHEFKKCKIKTSEQIRIKKVDILGPTTVKNVFSLGLNYLFECVIDFENNTISNLKYFTSDLLHKSNLLFDDVIISKDGYISTIKEIDKFNWELIEDSFE